MALIHEFEKNGNWLYRRREWLPLFAFIFALVYLWFADYDTVSYNFYKELIFLSVSLVGEAVRIITIGRVPKGTSVRNVKSQVADELNKTGIYSVLRHPLYLGNYLMWLGPVLFLRSFWAVVIFSLIYWIYYERIMFAEEQFLRKKFGKEFDNWSEKTGPFFPSFRNFKKASLSFSVRNVLKREYHGVLNLFVIFGLLDLVRNYSSDGQVTLNNLWLYSLPAVGILWVILRIITKKTSLLDVNGR